MHTPGGQVGITASTAVVPLVVTGLGLSLPIYVRAHFIKIKLQKTNTDVKWELQIMTQNTVRRIKGHTMIHNLFGVHDADKREHDGRYETGYHERE